MVETAEVGAYAVVPVLHFERSVFEQYRMLRKEVSGEGHNIFPVSRGLVDAVVEVLLDDATLEFLHDEPGRALSVQFQRDPIDILRAAARQLMLRVGWVNGDVFGVHGLFETCTTIASMRHEKAASLGGLIVAPPQHPSVAPVVQFAQPFPLRSANWTRKVLELTSKDLYLLSDTVSIYGLGQLGTYDGSREDLYVIAFTGFHVWDLRHADRVLMRTSFGVPGLPAERFSRHQFIANAKHVFDEMTDADAEVIWDTVDAAALQKKGTMVMIVRNAAEEAERLSTQATPIAAQVLTSELVGRLTGIDGALLLDPHGVCHAIGVIFDGEATNQGDPARGARYNSAIRYISTSNRRALAVVISEDGSFDVRPMLQPRVQRTAVADVVSAVRKLAEGDDWRALPQVRERIEEFRFYFDDSDCAQLNADLATLKEKVISSLKLWVEIKPLASSEAMNTDYFLD